MEASIINPLFYKCEIGWFQPFVSSRTFARLGSGGSFPSPDVSVVIFIDDSHFSDFSFGLGPVNISWVVLSNFLYRRSKTYLLVTRAYLLAGNPNRYWPCQFEGDTGPDFKPIGSFHRAHAPSNKEGA
jgi:hypothetical protein